MTGGVVHPTVREAYEASQAVGDEHIVLNFDATAAGVTFKRQCGNLLIDPTLLDAIREVSDRGMSVVVEEARFYDAKAGAQLSGRSAATDDSTFQRVICKSYRPNFISTNAELHSCIDEARRIHGLKHPHLVPLLGVGCFKATTQLDQRSSFYYVEEFAGSWSLFKMLRSKWLHPTHPHVQFTPYDCMRWCLNIAEALAYLHEHGVVHRDIKAENVFLSDSDVHETIASIGDLKPHRRNFRKTAHGHLRRTRSRDVREADDSDESPRAARGLGAALSQFSLSRHNSLVLRSLRQQRSQTTSEHDAAAVHEMAAAVAAAAAPHLPLEGSRSFKKKELSSSFMLRHSNEALPLRLSKEHPDLDENEGSHSFVEAIEKTLHTEMDSDVLKMQPSIDNVVKKMTSAKRGGMEPGSDGVDGGSGRASSSGPRLSGNQVPGRPASGNGAQQGDTSATGPSRLSNVTQAPRAAAAAAAEVASGADRPSGQRSSGGLGPSRGSTFEDAAAAAIRAVDAEKTRTGTTGTSAQKKPASEAGSEARDRFPGPDRPLRSSISKAGMKRNPDRRVNFTNTIPEGMPATEDYSLIYMAPEYVKDMNCDTLHSLSTKGDVFAFAKLMFEIFCNRLINPAATVGAPEGWHTTPAVLEQYAKKVAEGFREELPRRWPPKVKFLINRCWAQDPSQRPGMHEVLAELQKIAADDFCMADLVPPPPPPELVKKQEEEDEYYDDDDDEEEEDEEDEDGNSRLDGEEDEREGAIPGIGSGRLGAGSGRMGAGSGRLNAGSGRLNVGSGRVNSASGRANVGSGRMDSGSGRRTSRDGAEAPGTNRAEQGKPSQQQYPPLPKKSSGCCVIS